ncbi:MAG TPA: hypothetical protein VIY08_06435, partial [Candidatus Nitrosocosmicus sp.]
IIISSNYNGYQSTLAQKSNTTSVGTFSAKGYTGQTFVLPNLILTPNQVKPPVGTILGGNWSFAVNDGQIKQFHWFGHAYTLVGKINGTLFINGISNASNFNIAQPSSSDPIKLIGNSTSFKGNVNININNKTAWKDIPAIVKISNGKLMSLQISDEATEGAFTVPLFGVVTSLTK